jgi:hypothetical protein
MRAAAQGDKRGGVLRGFAGFAVSTAQKARHRTGLKFARMTIPHMPQALLTLSFRLDLPIYRRYNPRT